MNLDKKKFLEAFFSGMAAGIYAMNLITTAVNALEEWRKAKNERGIL